jgi:iron uptake system EfeUOB component EfeO/EfeM
MINSFFADENEKVFYLKSVIDTSKVNTDNFTNSDEFNKLKQSSSNIDELVKKQLEEENKKPEEALTAFKNNDFEKALAIYGSLLQK